MEKQLQQKLRQAVKMREEAIKRDPVEQVKRVLKEIKPLAIAADIVSKAGPATPLGALSGPAAAALMVASDKSGYGKKKRKAGKGRPKKVIV
jgi:hypothetical protein